MKNLKNNKHKNVLLNICTARDGRASLAGVRGLIHRVGPLFVAKIFQISHRLTSRARVLNGVCSENVLSQTQCSTSRARVLNAGFGLEPSIELPRQTQCSTSRARVLNAGFGAGVYKPSLQSGLTSRARVLILTLVMVVFGSVSPILFQHNNASAAPSETLNFQGRILSIDGGLVADGFYNIEFNLYNAASGGSSLWTETRDYNGGAPDNRVRVQNGYFSVYLGDITALPNIDYSQELYLTMNIGGSGTTPSWDGEMNPRFRLTAVPYAFRAANLASGDVDSADSDDVTVTTGDATTSGTSGDIIIDNGAGATANGGITLGATNASSLTLGRSGLTTTNAGALTVTQLLTASSNLTVNGNTILGSDTSDTLTVEANATFNGSLTVSAGDQFTNAGSTLFTAITIANDVDGGVLGGNASTTVDVATTLNVNQTTASQTFTLPTPTSTTAGRIVYINNIGSTSFTLEGSPIAAGESSSFIWNGTSWVQTISFTSTGVDTIGSLDGGSANANGASIAGTTLYLQSASATQPGLVNTTTQTFAGVKTFNNGLVVAAGQTLRVIGGNTASRPGSPTAGMIYYDTNTNSFLVYNGTKWVADQRDAIYVASTSTSSQADQDRADYLVDGTSDEDEINSALTAAAGAKVVLLEGTYTADGTILIPNNTTLSGVGSGTVIQLSVGVGTDNLIEATGTNRTGQVIRDLALDGSLGTGGTQYGIYLSAVGDGVGGAARTGASIMNVIADDFVTTAILLDASDNSTISNTRATNSVYGIRLDNGSSNNTIVGNTAQGNTTNGFRLDASSDNTVTGNTNEGSGSTGFYVLNSSNNALTGNTSKGTTTNGFRLTGSSYNTVTGNNSSNNTSSGVRVDSSSAYNVISSNTINTNGVGIYLDITEHNQISNNVINDSGGALTNNGIYLFSASNYNQITSNTITDGACSTTCYAINILDSTSNKNYLEGNRYWDTDVDAGDDATINDAGTNTIYVNQQTNTVTSEAYDVSDFTFRGSANSTTAFEVQNASGTNILNVDTTNGELEVTGNIIATGNLQIDGNTTLGNASGDTLTVNAGSIQFANNFTSCTAITTDASGNLGCSTSTYLTSSSAFIQNGNDFGGNAVLGTNGVGQTLAFETANTTRFTISSTVSTLAGSGATSILGGTTLNLGSIGANALTLATNGSTRFTVASGASTLTGSGATTIVGGTTLSLTSTTTSAVTLDSGTTGAINIGTGANAKTITLGNGTGATSLILNAGTGNIDIGVNAVQRTINLGTSTAAQTINVGGTGANIIAIGNTQTAGSISIGAALTTGTINIGGTGAQTGTINIGAGTGAQAINFGTGAGAKTTTVGSSNTTSSTAIQSGSGGISLSGNTTVSGTNTFTVGTGATQLGGNLQVNGNTTFGDAAGDTLTVNAGSIQFANNFTSCTAINTDASGNLGCDTNTYLTSATISLQGAYNGGNSILATNTGGDIDLTVSEATNFSVDITGTGSFLVQDNGSNVLQVQDGGAITFNLTDNTSSIFTIQEGANPYIDIDTSDAVSYINFGNTTTNPRYNFNGTGNFTVGGSVFGINQSLNTLSGRGLNWSLNSVGTDNYLEIRSDENSNDYGSRLWTSDSYGALMLGSDTSTGYLAVGTALSSGQVEISDSAGSTFGARLRVIASGATENAFIVNNGTGTGSILVAQDNGTAVLSVVDGGGATLQNVTDSANAFRVLSSAGGTYAGAQVLGVDTTNFAVDLAATRYQTVTNTSCGTNCSITQANVDTNAAIIVNATANGITISLPDPTDTTAGRLVYITAANGSEDFTLIANGGGTNNEIAMRQNTTATMIWNGADWTAAGASSSTTLQAAYNNTLTSAGGAEIVLNNTATSNGLTVRNNASNPIIGSIFEAQTSIGSNLFSVNNNAVEYATNGGAEDAFSGDWSATPDGGTVTRYTTVGDYIATGIGSVSVVTGATANQGAENTLSTALTPNLRYSVSFAVRGTAGFNTLDVVYSPDGTNTGTVACATGQTVTQGAWTRVTCYFDAPASGITSSNAIFIRQSDATARTFYIENLSVTVKADVNHAADGSVDDAGSFTTNWTAAPAGGTLARDTTVIYDTSGAASVTTTATIGHGLRNNMAITPTVDTQYLVTFYARSSNTFDDIRVRYSRDGGTSTVPCVDYNTQSVSTVSWTRITCLFTTDGTAPTNADLIIDQPTGVARTFYVDALSITLNTNTASNVKIGGGSLGGPTTLLTLDRSAGPPVAANNDAYLGSMYYDTLTGRIQCYESGGWGTCGAPPDNIVNLNPEYAGSVLNGSGIGTMEADVCANESGVLQVNSSLCGTGEARNFYRWTSPQATEQTYSVYVTYQLPSTFDGFASDDTVQLTGRVDSIANATVSYEMFKSQGGTLSQCGTETVVAGNGAGAADTWYTVGINGNESTGCSFNSSSANGFVLFKINLSAESNANAYVSTLTFTTTGR